tara:strand:- start:608 stop:907 length:300 start_codon:yes stop_codon:yes gene_type:complete
LFEKVYVFKITIFSNLKSDLYYILPDRGKEVGVNGLLYDKVGFSPEYPLAKDLGIEKIVSPNVNTLILGEACGREEVGDYFNDLGFIRAPYIQGVIMIE